MKKATLILRFLIIASILPFVANSQVIDIDGNVYKIVIIGKQKWMGENLKTTKFNDGTSIQVVTDNNAWGNLKTPGYSWYKNDAVTYKATYGALYNWYAVNTGKLCPLGWHVPSDDDWTVLTNYLGDISLAGGKLKETGTNHWTSPNTGATNETGFTALPGGSRHVVQQFNYVGRFGNYWSGTTINANYSWFNVLSNDNSTIYRGEGRKRNGHSVRCLQDY
jgi:uncharacterized protein (TIGR02145 family)